MNSHGNRRIAVIGAGIIGLTSALRLKQNNFEVEVFARDLTPQTTSAVAGAFWYPYKVAVGNNTHSWSGATYGEYRLQCTQQVPGVKLLPLVELFRGEFEKPPWIDIVEGYKALGPHALPAGFKSGFEFVTPIADTRRYLPWLVDSVLAAGVKITHAEVTSPDELLEDNFCVVNCAGLGSRELVHDAGMFPIRGQVQIVERPRFENRIVIYQEPELTTYIVPRTDDCLLGGTAEENNWNLEIDLTTASGIRNRCEALVPELRGMETIENLVGLRPARKEIRLESERRAEHRLIIHNYGHGGAGFTTCWGCADAVVELASVER